MVTLDQAGWNRERVLIVPPPANLTAVVEFLWLDERHRLTPTSEPWRIVADDAPHVICIALDTESAERYWLNVVGARTRYADVDCSQRLFTVGARLRPGSLPALFGVPAHELTNRSVPAEILVRAAARRLLAALATGSAEHAAALVASFLGELALRADMRDDRAQRVSSMVAAQSPAVRDLANAFGLGARALRSWSAAHLGLGLRRFMRIRRLHAALEHRLTHPRETWSRIAASTGFADQSHLVRDCRALLGESPTEFFSRAS